MHHLLGKRGSARRSRVASPASRDYRGRLRNLAAGDTEGNERLTVLAGLLLIPLLAVLGITIIRIGQLIWLHLFLGLVLIGPVALKLASTGNRFGRYYSGNRAYRAKGPPPPALRALAPVVVLLTVIVFATGVVLLLIGPGASLRPQLVLIHKVSFIVWIAATAVHVLGHVPEVARLRRVSPTSRRQLLAISSPEAGSSRPPDGVIPGAAGRWLSLATAVVLGLVLAAALIPHFSAWTGPHALHHHHFRQ
jgi:hypothetical protein